MNSNESGKAPDILLTICPPWGVLNPPLGLAYLAESLDEQNIDIEIQDLNVQLYKQVKRSDQTLWKTKNDSFWRKKANVDQLLNKWQHHINGLCDTIAGSGAAIIGFSIVDPNEFISAAIARIIKEKSSGKIIIGGGPGCADLGQRKMLQEHSNNGFDYFLTGEAEHSLWQLVKALQQGKEPETIDNLVIARRTLHLDKPVVRPQLDSISFPTFKHFDINWYGRSSLAVMWSRGCIGRCLYCKERALWGPYRMRSTDSILSEIEHAVRTLKINNLVLYDSAINGNPKRLFQICDTIIKKRLKITWSAEAIALKSMDTDLLQRMSQAGCHTLVYGIESGSDNILASMRKLCDTETAAKVIRRTHEAGIKVAINILVGFPGESNQDFEKTIDFLEENSQYIDRLDGVSSLQIVADTPLQKRTEDFGIVLPEKEANDKWFIPDSNTFEIRQKRLAEVLEVAQREGFEVGRTFLDETSSQPARQQGGWPKPVPYKLSEGPKDIPGKPSDDSASGSSGTLPIIDCFAEKTTDDPTSKNILMVTCQALPEPGKPTTGGSLRAQNLGDALKSCGHQVAYSVPQDCLTREQPGINRQMAHDGSNIADIVRQTGAEIVLFGNWGLACAAGNCDVPTVIDMNGPLVLENFYRSRDQQFQDSIAKLEAIAKTDYIIAGSKRQKSYLTAWSLMAGIKPDNLSIGIVPYSLPPATQKTEKSDDLRFIVAGYDWPWLAGDQQIQTVCDELARCNNGTLHLFTSQAPYSDSINENSSADSSGKLGKLEQERLIKHQPVDFEQLTEELAKATVALDLWQHNPERDLAFPSRAVAYLRAGLPVITSPDGELAELINTYKAGWLIDSNDPDRLTELTKEIVQGTIDIKTYSNNARRLFEQCLLRDRTITDLDQFCRHPRFNRTISPFVAKHFFSKELVSRLQNQLKHDRSRIRMWSREVEMIRKISRRPRGLALLASSRLLGRRLRRFFVGFPVLYYLLNLTIFGYFFHLWIIRKEKKGKKS